MQWSLHRQDHSCWFYSFIYADLFTGKTTTADSIHVRPAASPQVAQTGHLPARFDTALVNDGTGKDTGIEGLNCQIASGILCWLTLLNQDTVLAVYVLYFPFHQRQWTSCSMQGLKFQNILSTSNGTLHFQMPQIQTIWCTKSGPFWSQWWAYL